TGPESADLPARSRIPEPDVATLRSPRFRGSDPAAITAEENGWRFIAGVGMGALEQPPTVIKVQDADLPSLEGQRKPLPIGTQCHPRGLSDTTDRLEGPNHPTA